MTKAGSRSGFWPARTSVRDIVSTTKTKKTTEQAKTDGKAMLVRGVLCLSDQAGELIDAAASGS